MAGLGVSLSNRLRLLKAAGTGSTVMSPVSEAVAPIASASASAPATLASPLAPKMPPAAQRGNDVERRSLTVMFCDLADSTALSTRLDPEDLQDVIRAYQEICAKLIQEYSGYIAKYMSDGILVYFGYPKALEPDTERAVRSAVAIVEAMAGLNQTVGRDIDVEIAVRIGIATDVVMVGEVIGEGMAQERTVVGEAPNMAARLQSLAGRNGIVIGALTKEITGDAFFYSETEATELKGIAGLVKLWEVTGLHHDAADEDFFTGAEGNAEIPELVGRDEEIGLLRRAWQSVQEEARGQVISISGEAGIGKSVLVDGQRAVVRAEGQMQIALRSSPYHTNSTLYPVIEFLKRLTGWQPDDDAEARLAKLVAVMETYDQPIDETTAPLVAELMSLAVPEDRYPTLDLTPNQQKQRTQDVIIAIILESAERAPLLQL